MEYELPDDINEGDRWRLPRFKKARDKEHTDTVRECMNMIL